MNDEPAATLPAGDAGIDTTLGDGVMRLAPIGAWTIATAGALRDAIDSLNMDSPGTIILDLSRLETLDTAGALLIGRLRRLASRTGRAMNEVGTQATHAALIDRVALASGHEPIPVEKHHLLVAMVERTGRAACDAYEEATDLLYFLGVTTVAAIRSFLRPGRIRFIPVLSHIEQVGFNSLPIVGLLSFLIGIVVAYQGADQLRQFGAEIFTVDLLGVSILREMGILLAAIVIAGRSGSAFAAQIGTMRVNQEVDAMLALGLNPVEILVLPRVMALVICMPLIAVYADIMALLGGGLMVILTLDISLLQFLERLQSAVRVSAFWVGLIKAPVFGFAIALTGCREGLKVTGSAESVGHHTTRAVVVSIFLVIVADALFSILFSAFGI
ncbi:MAG: phospholipid/cholesterol/gamma-HCH transport system permease protein [Alphaproteobacteria bacterium]|jgi:phospholipid/cholesterol/gamma-HCH transport system permease protein